MITSWELSIEPCISSRHLLTFVFKYASIYTRRFIELVSSFTQRLWCADEHRQIYEKVKRPYKGSY